MDGDYERYLYEQLDMLRREYEKAAAPLIKQLVHIRVLELPRPIFLGDLNPDQIERVNATLKSHGVV